MAKNIIIVFLCLVAILLVESHAQAPAPAPARAPAPTLAPALAPMLKPNENQPGDGTTEGSLQPEECDPRCQERCSETHHKKPCLFYCKKCCATCLCVPPGTYGNKEVCPCYNNWKTKRGGPKCP